MTTDTSELRIPPFRKLLDEGMRPTRRHFKAIYPAVAIPIAVAATLQTIAQAWMMNGFVDFVQVDPELPGNEILSAFGAPWAVVMLLALLVGVLYAIGINAMFAACCDAVTGVPIVMRRRWLWAVTPRVFGTMLLVWIPSFLGMMCCLLPGVILSVIFAFTIPVMVLERRFGSSAISRSYELVNHNPGGQLSTHPGWRVLAIGVVTILMGYVVMFIVQLPFMIVQQIMMFRSFAENPETTDPASFMSSWMWLQVPQVILGQLANVAIWLYAGFVLVLLFEALRRRKEGADIEAVLDDLGAPEVQEPPA